MRRELVQSLRLCLAFCGYVAFIYGLWIMNPAVAIIAFGASACAAFGYSYFADSE